MSQRRPPHGSTGDASALAEADLLSLGQTSLVRFEDFYRRELPGLIVLARGLCGSSIAEEVAQEAMLAAYRRWGNNDLQHPEAWVRRVCANLAVSRIRRRSVELRALIRLGGRRLGLECEQPAHEDFWRAVRELPRRQAQAVALRYVFDLTVADIAETLECSEGAVKVHLSRGRSALAARLNATTGGDV
jgi:RNA polymerase sigma-70 factor (ECF subfamily)